MNEISLLQKKKKMVYEVTVSKEEFNSITSLYLKIKQEKKKILMKMAEDCNITYEELLKKYQHHFQ